MFHLVECLTSAPMRPIPLTRDLLWAMRAANTLGLNVVSVADRAVHLEVALSGLSKTYDRIKQAAKHSVVCAS